MLRVVGMRRAQVGRRGRRRGAAARRRSPSSIGVPVGIVVGRLVWNGSTDSLGALDRPGDAVGWRSLVAVPVTLGDRGAPRLVARRDGPATSPLAASLRTE